MPDQELSDQGEIPEYAHQSIGDSGHGLDEDVQGHADHIFTGIAYGIAGNGCLVSCCTLAVAFQPSLSSAEAFSFRFFRRRSAANSTFSQITITTPTIRNR